MDQPGGDVRLTAKQGAHSGPRARCVLIVCAFAIAAVTLAPTVFDEPDRFDEGFIASGAMMVLRGWLPVRDLFVIYGPGQFYTVAALYHVFGEDLAVSRAMHVLLLALWAAVAAVSAFTLSRQSIGVAAVAALAFTFGAAFANPNATYPAIPAALLLVASTWGLARWFAARSASPLLAASLMVGIAALYRWDFGVFGFFSLAMTVLVVHANARSTRRQAALDLVLLAGPFALVIAAGFGPLLYAGGWQRWLDEVPLFMIREFAKWRALSLVEPTLVRIAESWAAGDGLGLARAGFRLLFAGTPFLLITMAGVRLLSRARRGANALQLADVLALATALLALCLLNQMRVRATLWQGFPAFAVSLPLLGYLLQGAAIRGRLSRRHARAVGLAVSVLVLVLLPFYLIKDGVRDGLTGKWVQLHLPRANGTQIPRWLDKRGEWLVYPEMVEFIRANTAPDEPIFSGVQDTSRLVLNDALLYFIVDRPSATRWIEMEPGLTNTLAGQRELIEVLERSKVRVLVLWNKLSTEPNATSRSNGVHLFDAFVRANYAVARQFGDYLVMVRTTVFRASPDEKAMRSDVDSHVLRSGRLFKVDA